MICYYYGTTWHSMQYGILQNIALFALTKSGNLCILPFTFIAVNKIVKQTSFTKNIMFHDYEVTIITDWSNKECYGKMDKIYVKLNWFWCKRKTKMAKSQSSNQNQRNLDQIFGVAR